MDERPTGTVSLLFTDIEGSTRLLHALGPRYEEVLADHRRLLRQAFSAHGGHEVDTQGDAFFVVFARARDAVTAAVVAQRALSAHPWPEREEVRVRMGIHTGEPSATREGYVGLDLHRGARICSAAHGGQILLSASSAELVADGGLEETALLDLGEHRLKDLSRPQRLFQLVARGLDREFPPLRTLDAVPTNLAPEPTPFVGRERELREVAELVRKDDIRLVTLTGPGGTGKTRLATQAAAELVDDFDDGVFLVPLVSVIDPDLVAPTIAQAVGVREIAGESLAAFLRRREILLVLDNLEQLVEAVPLVAELLVGTEHLKILATSREGLRLSAERVYPVPPLAAAESVELFVGRAQAVKPGYAAGGKHAAAVAEICARLEGLPLALELAAARATVLGPEAMLERLDQRLALLTSGARDRPGRHQTLRDAIDWSYDLLTAEEQALFARLAVFSGGWMLEAAEAVADADLDVLASLVDKSLVRQEEDRFWMLETIREYALERLVASGEADLLRRRHASGFLVWPRRVTPRGWTRRRAGPPGSRLSTTTYERRSTGSASMTRRNSGSWQARSPGSGKPIRI